MDGLTPDLYKVTVGGKKCEDVTVTDNYISCLPPRTEPRELHPRVTVRTSLKLNKFTSLNKLHYDKLFKIHHGTIF